MPVIFLKNVRLSYPDLFEPKAFEEGTPRYGAQFLTDEGDANDKLIRKTIAEAIAEAFPDAKHAASFKKKVEGQKGQFCYRDGDTVVYDSHQGHWFLAAHRGEDKGPPAIVDNKADPATGKPAVLTAASGRIYSGCYVNAKVEIWVQSGKYTGVRATLLAVQFAADGEAFAGSPASADGFETVESDESGDANDFF